MTSSRRREKIKNLLIQSQEPIKGQELAEMFQVTRQVIVKDIAIIRAEGIKVISTPKGYMDLRENINSVKKVIAVNHGREDVKNELETIVKYGAVVEDVIVEHPLYGEIRAMLMIKNMMDIENFYNNFNQYEAEPLSALTNGVHLHTIICESDGILSDIIEELDKKGFLIKEL
ncbi:transcription repressor NadR [Clostridium sp. UBA1056]|uniref:transcription repressor NadR n=1 Tax=unclassified Clostridium TaxID=2614128 RepID=UPI0032168D45